jgi:hypothetical protein
MGAATDGRGDSGALWNPEINSYHPINSGSLIYPRFSKNQLFLSRCWQHIYKNSLIREAGLYQDKEEF